MNDSVEGKRCLVSGSGNVARYTVEKINQLGGKVVTLSDSNGFICDPNGIDEEKLVVRSHSTAFGAATDDAPGALKTANAITDDSSADATGTLGYCRASSSSVADTPLVDQIDGEAGTSGADWIFNTLEIVSGAVVSITSWLLRQAES